MSSDKSSKRVFFSMSMRFIAPVEHANMIGQIAETNITKHRYIYVPVRVKDKYVLKKLPAISGQAVLNAFERALVDLAKEYKKEDEKKYNKKLLDENCEKYDFIKHANDKQGQAEEWIKNCIVEDVTGFLAPEAKLRKTSTVWFSYMVPDIEVGSAILDYQMFTRYTREKQMIGQRESGHAVYRLSMFVDVSRIGYTEDGNDALGNDDERKLRIELTFKALKLMINGGYIGANKTRALFNEYVNPQSFVIAVSSPLPFMVNPAEGEDYIGLTIMRAQNFINELKDIGQKIIIIYGNREGKLAYKEEKTSTNPEEKEGKKPEDKQVNKEENNLQTQKKEDLNAAIDLALETILKWMGLSKS
jgi:CRISPR-associated protein Cas7/Csa2 subtype I-A